MAKPMNGKWKTQILELQAAGVKTGNICNPQRLYRAMLKLKGHTLPKWAKIHPETAVRHLKEYRQTGILQPPENLVICKPKPKTPYVPPVETDEFLISYAWRKLRYEALKKHGAQCSLCGRGRKHGVVVHVDHIKPRRLYPELALVLDNLQPLCEDCNHGKGNWDETDWR
ncbi:HNH endonuclease [Zavarzinella formosa]|uniref:HNH endonuclease n=1 Tax=Zavarzinella formosa TaxID=360055 RepID=UPI00036541F2|nr:HNH endonuclease [Zavarzinella formosa]